jgi:hypothetical protein
MLSELRKSLCITLALAITLTPVLPAQQTSTSAAPVPAQIAEAHAIFVSNGGGSNYYNIFTGGPDRAYNTLYADLEKTNRYRLVGSPSEADLIFEIRAIAPAVGGPHDTVDYNPQLILDIIDPRTHATLWTTSANVLAFGAKHRRDRQFDSSVAVLMDKLGEITGQPLTQAQVKAVNDNSRMPMAAKVFIIAGLAVAAAFMSYGIYRATHPPTLPTLTPPTQPSFPATH